VRDQFDNWSWAVILVLGVVLMGLSWGCATQHGLINVVIAAKAPVPISTPVPVYTIEQNEVYTVVKHDCLWSIAAKSTVYSDPFCWPILWKANHDQVKNPDLIEVGQVLTVRRMVDDVKLVRKFASQWPERK
jgi:hypothetical protein